MKGAFDDADDVFVFGDFGAEGFFHFRLGGFGLVVDFVEDDGGLKLFPLGSVDEEVL